MSITSAETLFPNKVTFTGISNRTLIFLEDTIHPTTGGKADCIKYLCISVVGIMLLYSVSNTRELGKDMGEIVKEEKLGNLGGL